MTSSKRPGWDSHFFLAVQIILSTIIIYVISSSSGCSEEPEDLGGESLGKATSTNEIADAYNELFLNKSPFELRVGDASLYESNYRIELSSIIKTFESIRHIEEITIKGDILTILVSEISFVYDQYGQAEEIPRVDKPIEFTLVDESPDEGEDVGTSTVSLKNSEGNSLPLSTYMNLQNRKVKLNKIRLAGLNKQAVLTELMAQGRKDRVELMDRTIAAAGVKPSNEIVSRISYHNLRVRDISVEAPEAVRNQPNCLGIPGCNFNAREISFDEAWWKKNDSFDKVKTTWVVTNEIPSLDGRFVGYGLAGLLSQCQTRIVKVQTDEGDRELLARVCDNVLRDIRYGSDEP